jgi:RNA polymerase sigma-70 factor (ECF subfamily)
VPVTTELPPHFFRHESGRLVAALTRVFGVHNLALAEDVTQEALSRALDVWKLHGTPDNPSAWLLTTAKHLAVDALRRDRTARTYAPELGRLLDSEWTLVPAVDEVFAPSAVKDDELRMMFTVCHPRLPEDAQIALVLHLSCGFSVGEIAAAFFASPAAIEKRIARAKSTLAETRSLFHLDDAVVADRLGAVQSAIYLLFNEGYHGASPESAVRDELCREALRLVTVLAEHPRTGIPATRALASLLSLHAARLPARVSAAGLLRSLFEQDRSQWDAALVARGLAFLAGSATGESVTEYHVEAAIAAHHATARSREETPWRSIVELYDVLLTMRPSPVVALSRAIAVAEAFGPSRGLAEIGAIEARERLATYPFYEAALGELHLRADERDVARGHFEAALALARNAMERRFFEERVKVCGA